MDTVIQFCGENVRVSCDQNCNKAWGIQDRPKVLQSETDADDYVWASDDELGDAPKNPGTYEAGEGKPAKPENWNKWCVRACERCKMRKNTNLSKPPVLTDFSKRRFNKPNSVFK